MATFREVVGQLDDNDSTVALFSHNPGITAFVNLLTDTIRVDNMPTCAVFAVKGDTDHWRDFFSAKRELLFFDYPKMGTQT
jgi:phosphohistidine phosphatase